MAAVLVTGGTGFIGSHLVERLVDRGDRVRCLVRRTSSCQALRELGVELVDSGFDDVARLNAAAADVDVVYHVAGAIKALDPAQFYAANETATARLVEACVAAPRCPHLVMVSSVAASGPAARGELRREPDPPAPISHYGRSKLAAEQVAEKFAAKMPLTIVRPGVVFGPRDSGFRKILRTIRFLRVHPSPGWCSPALSYIHIADLVELLIRAAEHGQNVPGDTGKQPGQGRYFAVAPEHPTYADLGRILRKMLARPRAPIVPVAGPLAYCIAGITEVMSRLRGQPEELSIDKIRDALAPSWACSGEAAKRDLGFLPARPLADRLQETIDWYAAHSLI
jgi:nucleoside-diphosphate-sugar epimerase